MLNFYVALELCKSTLSCCTVGWSVEFFFIRQNRSSNQRSGMILEVQIQNFGARRRTRVKVFIFEKFQGV